MIATAIAARVAAVMEAAAIRTQRRRREIARAGAGAGVIFRTAAGTGCGPVCATRVAPSGSGGADCSADAAGISPSGEKSDESSSSSRSSGVKRSNSAHRSTSSLYRGRLVTPSFQRISVRRLIPMRRARSASPMPARSMWAVRSSPNVGKCYNSAAQCRRNVTHLSSNVHSPKSKIAIATPNLRRH